MGNAKIRKWTDDRVREAVMEVHDALLLDRMPTKRECDSHYQNSCLSSIIGKRYGWHNLANQMGLPIKDSESGFGKLYEAKATDILRSMGFEVERMSYRYPYDLLLNSCVKLDVKASKLYREDMRSYYSFCIDKPFATCDFYLLMTLDDDGTINRKMVVPSNMVFSNSQISVGEHKSRYHQYTDRFDLLGTASDFWSGLMGDVTA